MYLKLRYFRGILNLFNVYTSIFCNGAITVLGDCTIRVYLFLMSLNVS